MAFNPGAGRLFVISGPSGAGKGTVIREVLRRKPGMVLSVSATTRPARPHERNGVDYRFISVPQFLGMRDRGEFLESAEVYGNFYGTPRSPVDASIAGGKSVILELDIQGALSVKRGKPDAVLIFIEPPSLDELFLRLRGRGTEETENLSERMRAAYEELKNKGIYDHIVINDDLGRATDELVRIIEEKERNAR
ncbi:MAG TPA: guanylate kinase [Actinomycetota bacterium]|nr:guanylate kinase [Actinomycetota bacterium]